MISRGNIFGAVVGGKVLISKQSLIGYLATPDVVRKVTTAQMKNCLLVTGGHQSNKEQRNGLKMCLRLFLCSLFEPKEWEKALDSKCLQWQRTVILIETVQGGANSVQRGKLALFSISDAVIFPSCHPILCWNRRTLSVRFRFQYLSADFSYSGWYAQGLPRSP